MNTRALAAIRSPSGGRAGAAAAAVVHMVAEGAAAIAARIRRLLAAWRACVDASARRDRKVDWEQVAREQYLRRALDVYDVERRQRHWDRDESDGHRISGWP